MTIEIVAVAGLCGMLLGALFMHVLHKSFDPVALTMDFQKRFPGKCPVCSYQSWGIMNGHIGLDHPMPDHECIHEKNKKELKR